MICSAVIMDHRCRRSPIVGSNCCRFFVIGGCRTCHLCALISLTINWTTYVWAVVHDHVIETALGDFLSPLGTIRWVSRRCTKLSRSPNSSCSSQPWLRSGSLTFSYGPSPWLALIIANVVGRRRLPQASMCR